jgi:hypothetical protein
MRQSLTESFVLAIGGGASGLLLAVWTTRILERVIPSVRSTFPIELDLSLDAHHRVRDDSRSRQPGQCQDDVRVCEGKVPAAPVNPWDSRQRSDRDIVEPDGLPEDCRRPVEFVLPQFVADHGNGVASRRVVRGASARPSCGGTPRIVQ